MTGSPRTGPETRNANRRYDPELLSSRGKPRELDPEDIQAHRAAIAEDFADFRRPSDSKVAIADIEIGPAGESLRLRTYTPAAGARGTLLWLHGGAFAVGSPAMDDDLCCDIAARHALLVAAPDYRLVPEHPFPAAEHDCMQALSWLARSLPAADGVSIAGVSAGGALALRTCLEAVGTGQRVDRLVLTYPVVDPSMSTHSMRRYRTAPVFDAGQAELMWRRYLGGRDTGTWPMPLRDSRLGSLPMTLVITTEHDPLRDEGMALTMALLNEGVSVQALHIAGAYHAFDRYAPDSSLARQLKTAVIEFLARPLPVIADW